MPYGGIHRRRHGVLVESQVVWTLRRKRERIGRGRLTVPLAGDAQRAGHDDVVGPYDSFAQGRGGIGHGRPPEQKRLSEKDLRLAPGLRTLREKAGVYPPSITALALHRPGTVP